jgi:hypothetical protein
MTRTPTKPTKPTDPADRAFHLAADLLGDLLLVLVPDLTDSEAKSIGNLGAIEFAETVRAIHAARAGKGKSPERNCARQARS